MYTLLNDVKEHLLIDKDFHDDDNYLISLIEVCEDAVEKDLGYKYTTILEEGRLPKSVSQAILLLIGNFYNNREAVVYGSPVEVPLAYRYLLNLQRNWSIP